MLPVITIAKENMVSNCFKNEEIRNVRDDFKDLQKRLNSFETQLNKINLFNKKLNDSELRMYDKIGKVESWVNKQESKLKRFDSSMTDIIDTYSTYNTELKLRKSEFKDLKEYVLHKQISMEEDVIQRIDKVIPLIDKYKPLIHELREETCRSVIIGESTKADYRKINVKLQESEKKFQLLRSKVQHLQEHDIYEHGLRL